MFGHGQPFSHVLPERLDVHAALRRQHDLEKFAQGELGDRRAVAGENRLERLAIPQLGLRLDEIADTVEAKDDLRVHRMLDPERPVLIERGNTILWRDKICARLIGGDAHELEDCLLRRSVVP